MDIKRTKLVLDKIRKGEIKLVVQRFSPFSEVSREVSRSLSLPRYPEGAIISMLQRRLEEKEVELICLNCFNRWKTRVGRLDDRPKCRRCKAIRIGVVTEGFPNLKKGLGDEEKKIVSRVSASASLVVSYGKFAILTLAGRGIGVTTAARILRNFRFIELLRSEEERKRLLKEIWRAEIQYARTRGFWD